ncbi:hypothetical protein H9Q72_000477 [Fusarium xylarioides]|uniref:Xylanolytic transcriptional activator regulatory domain-containing protein n=1 Tax=Fusarium xylarioides TaxID=221167 RepID=A0A9P7IA61_9HYPO|nr:hypothetical protein H9Q70_000370 [Fusarium xylarioides]KAG5773951.1 hypothetical protein H9Q72_000477 [Fusarium xylarioides]KAG5786332.1 hypothetical protein H9Q73_000066 [Fusarium xylarioides]
MKWVADYMPSGPRAIPHSRKRKHSFAVRPATYTNKSAKSTISQGAANAPHDEAQPEALALVTPEQSDLSEIRSEGCSADQEPGLEQAVPYVGRTEILGPVPFSERLESGRAILSAEDSDTRCRQVLQVFNAGTTVSEPVALRLVNLFKSFCWTWAPIVEESWLLPKRRSSMPLLLLQSVLLAGSRVSSIGTIGQSVDLYQKAKARFFYGDNRMPLASVISALLLQWWSPTGPEQFSLGNSGFWMHIAVGLAHQLGLHREPSEGPHRGLRRRIWWTIVTRDILISIGVGRPRMINLEDSNVSPPTTADFQEESEGADVFIANVKICCIMGDLAERRRRSQFTPQYQQATQDALRQWLHGLPPRLRLFTLDSGAKIPNPYNLESRQIHIVFFVTLIILTNADNPLAASVTSLIASSFIASMFAEMQEAGDLQRLGPIFAFHSLAAALPLLSAHRLRSVSSWAAADFDKIYSALQELAEKWGSARGLLEPLMTAKQRTRVAADSSDLLESITPPLRDLFSEFGGSTCSLWCLLQRDATHSHELDTNVDDVRAGDYLRALQGTGEEEEARASSSKQQDFSMPDDTTWPALSEAEDMHHLRAPWELVPPQTSWSDDDWMLQLANTY